MWKAGPVPGDCSCLITLTGCYNVPSVLMYKITTFKIAARTFKTCSTGFVQLQQLTSEKWILKKKIPKWNTLGFSSLYLLADDEREGQGMCLACVKCFAFQRRALLVVRSSLSLLCDAGPSLWLNPSEAGVSHESLKLLNASVRSATFQAFKNKSP